MANGPYVGMGSVGPPAGSIPSANNDYTNLGKFPQALYVVRGTVLASFQATQYYDCATEFGRFTALYLGSGRGRLGANEGGGFLPGEQVFVAVSPSQPGFNAVILGRADYSKAGEYTPPSPLLVYPQVAGYEYAARMSGQAYSDNARLRNFNSGIHDLVDGDHVIHNMFGGAVGVEAFRTFLQATNGAGLFLYSEDAHTKLVGSRFQRITFSEEYEDRQLGPNITQVGRRVWYPGDALAEKQPQQLHLNGPAYGGSHDYLTYPDGANIIEESESRSALLHEYRGMDGSYVMSSAASIIFQKTFDVPMPIEVIEPDSPPSSLPATCEPIDIDKNLVARNVDTGAAYTGVVEDIRMSNTESANPLVTAMNVRGLADKLITWQARGGIDDLNQWTTGSKPSSIYGEKQPKDLLVSKDPSMWKCMPQTFALSLDPYGKTKRYYYGRAMIAITEDGSVVLQDAQGSQVMLSGGNIYLAAQHDIISNAGRNNLQMAGRDAAVRGGRHTDVSAQEGRLTMMATSQLTLMGGLDGFGGVLIESRGRAQDTIATGENPATSGGLILKSKYYAGIDAENVGIRARDKGLLTLDAGDAVLWRANNGSNFGSFGPTISANLEGGTEIVLGPSCIFTCKGLYAPDIFYENLLHTKSEQNSGGAWAYLTEVVTGSQTEGDLHGPFMGFANHPFDVAAFAAKWLSSAQYTIDSAAYFTIPEPEWMIRTKEVVDDNSVILKATVQDNFVDGTSPFPGFGAMIGYGLTELGNSGAPPDYGDNYEEEFSVNTGQPIDGRLQKGI